MATFFDMAAQATPTDEETRRVVQGYFDAWTSKRIDDAYALLADDLAFRGPNARYATRADFRAPLEGFAKATRAARITELVVDGRRAAMLYDCELPPPVGTIPIASFFEVEDGRIRSYVTLFDPTELRKLPK
jgi:ketosteroid isomerase-like protein